MDGKKFSKFVSQHQNQLFSGEGPAIDEDLPSNEPNEEDEKPPKMGGLPGWEWPPE